MRRIKQEGSITLTTVIIFAVILPLLLFATVFSADYLSRLQLSLSTSQFATDTLLSQVISYDESENKAVFRSIAVIEEDVQSIIVGNFRITDLDPFDHDYLAQFPQVEIFIYDQIPTEGLSINHEGKGFQFKKPGAIIVYRYFFKDFFKNFDSSYTITVVRQFQIH